MLGWKTLGRTNVRSDKRRGWTNVEVGQTSRLDKRRGWTNVEVGQMSCLCIGRTNVAFLVLGWTNVGRTNVEVGQTSRSDKCPVYV
jgi:hypothetical protein